MNTPLVSEINVPSFIGMEHEGFLEVNFKPLYTPGILVCDRGKAYENALPIACKGVLVLLDTDKRDVYVSYSGFSGIESSFCGNENSWLHRVMYKGPKADKTINTYIPDWDKAILMFDWENDIKVDKGEYAKKLDKRNNPTRIDKRIDEIIDCEVANLRKILLFEINNSSNWHLTNKSSDVPNDLKKLTGDSKDKNKLNPDSVKCRYYVTMVMELMEKIENLKIEFS